MLRIWSKKIVQVLKKYNSSKNIIFGITGDIDNLGIFVSEYGRPLAENLVDVYNRIIGASLKDYINNNTFISDFAFIPSGEEIFAIGLCNDEKMVAKLFSFIQNDLNDIIKKNCTIDAPYVSISFGYKIFDNYNFDELLNHIYNNDTQAANLSYLNIMKNMREELAFELDKSKFASLECSEFIFLRNCVYAKMREYKKNTKNSLIKISQQIKNNNIFMDSPTLINTKNTYGLDNQNLEILLDIINND